MDSNDQGRWQPASTWNAINIPSKDGSQTADNTSSVSMNQNSTASARNPTQTANPTLHGSANEPVSQDTANQHAAANATRNTASPRRQNASATRPSAKGKEPAGENTENSGNPKVKTEYDLAVVHAAEGQYGDDEYEEDAGRGDNDGFGDEERRRMREWVTRTNITVLCANIWNVDYIG